MEIKPDKHPSYMRKKFVTLDKIKKILEDIKSGSPNKHAALANGITESYFYQMIKQGKCDLEHEVFDSLEAFLVQSLYKIEQEEIKDCRLMIKSDSKSHKGAEWTLEHAYMSTFSTNAEYLDMLKRLDDIEQKIAKE